MKEYVMNLKREIVKHKTPILFTSTSFLKAIASLFTGFFIAKYISPSDYGIWTSLNLLVSYSLFLQAGVINGLNRELPFAYGLNKEVEAVKMAGTAQTYTVFISALILFIGCVVFISTPDLEPKTRYGVLAITFFIAITFYQNYLSSTFRSKNSFLKLSYIQIVDAVVNIVSLVLIIYYSYYGLIVKAVLVIIIYTFLLHLHRPIKVGLLWNKKIFINLIKVGLPIFALAFLEVVAATADKVLLLQYSTVEEVGLYSFAFYSVTIFTLFSSSIAAYFYPRMTYNYGKNNDKIILWKYAKKITGLLLVIMFPLAIVGYYIIPSAINSFFPNYILSTKAMQILIFAGLTKGSVIGVNILWSMKAWKYMISYQILYSLFLVIFVYIGVIIFKNKIEGVSYAILLANFLNLIVAGILSYKATHY